MQPNKVKAMKNTVKKVISITLAVLLLASLASCGGKSLSAAELKAAHDGGVSKIAGESFLEFISTETLGNKETGDVFKESFSFVMKKNESGNRMTLSQTSSVKNGAEYKNYVENSYYFDGEMLYKHLSAITGDAKNEQKTKKPMSFLEAHSLLFGAVGFKNAAFEMINVSRSGESYIYDAQSISFSGEDAKRLYSTFYGEGEIKYFTVKNGKGMCIISGDGYLTYDYLRFEVEIIAVTENGEKTVTLFEEFAKKAVSVSPEIVITPLVTTDSQKALYTEE